jgi:hypothetical protein
LPLSLASAAAGSLATVFRLTQGRAQTAHYSAADFLIAAASYLVVAVIFVAKLQLLDDVLADRNRLSAAQALRSSGPALVRTLVTMICYGLIISVGFVLLVIPGLYLSISLCAGVYLAALEGLSATAALQRSRELVRGLWWRTATVLTIAPLVVLAIYSAVMLIVGLLARLSGVAVHAGATQQLALWVVSAGVVAQFIIDALLSPVGYAIGLVLLRDLELRKSGSDLALRIEQAA